MHSQERETNSLLYKSQHDAERQIGIVCVNSSPTRLNGRHFADAIFKCIFMNEKFCPLILIAPQFVPKGQIQ